MTAQLPQSTTGKRPRWTLSQLRARSSDLRRDPLDGESWHTLQRWAIWFAASAWITAAGMAIAVAWLAVWESPKPVPFVQEEHGIVIPLHTYPVPGNLPHGR
jgi:hypothetical protein